MSEPNVGRPSSSVHALSLVLIALLAWPWSVVLTVVESSQIAIQRRPGTTCAPDLSGIHRLVHHDNFTPQSRWVVAPDFDRDEEEGDDVSLLSPLSFIFPTQSLPDIDPSAFEQMFPVQPFRTPPREQPRHLRC